MTTFLKKYPKWIFFLVNSKLPPKPQFQRTENIPKVGCKSKQTGKKMGISSFNQGS